VQLFNQLSLKIRNFSKTKARKYYILLTVHLDVTSGRWLTWRTILFI